MIKKLCFICISLIISFDIDSQYDDLHFHRITTEDGLSASWIRAIYQDELGFIWFGTSDGLNRFDGKNIIVYRPDETKRQSIVNGAITYITEIEKNMLWICTEQGVSILDREKNIFKTFSYLNQIRISHLLVDHENILWFSCNNGLYRFSKTDSSIIRYEHTANDTSSLIGNNVRMCYEDADNNLWVATSEGVDLFNRQTNKFSHFRHTGHSGSLRREQANAIVQDHKKRLWISFSEYGLDILDYRKEKGENKASFIHILDGDMNSLFIDRQNYLWVGRNMGQGISVINLNNFEPKKSLTAYNYRGVPEDKWSLGDNTISVFYEDHQNGIWVGTYAGGINYHSMYMKNFSTVAHKAGNNNTLSNNVVNCFIEDNRFFWVGTEEGLCRRNSNNGLFMNYFHDPSDPKSLGANGVICLYLDRHKNLWIGTWSGGLNKFNYKENNFQIFKTGNSGQSSICSNNVYSILEDSKGRLWIGTDGGGLNRYNYSTGKFTCFLHDPSNIGSLYHNAVNDICETHDGKLYVSVYHSLDLLDENTGTFSHYIHNKMDTTTICSGNILDIFEDSKHNLWIGTTAGLNYFDTSRQIFRRYSVKNGLPSNTIQAIIEDNNGNLWLSSNNGLSKFIDATNLPKNPVFVNYTVEDGLQGNEFVRRSTLRSSNGKLYFGGSKGYTYFFPDSIHENPLKPQIVLIDFRLFTNDNQEHFTLDKSIDINLINTVRLSYKESDFQIEYAALNYLNTNQNKYKYILEGFETEWHMVGNQREATYTNIDPGRYLFKVNGSNNDGVWSDQPKTIEIIITPPWWKTFLAKISFTILVILMIYGTYKLRVRILENQKKMLTQKVKERTLELTDMNSLLEEKQEEITMQNEELSKHRFHLERLVEERTEELEAATQRAESSDKLKSAFLANMSHEIRTPMNAIVGFTSLLKNDELDQDEQKEFINIISSNCDILMVLINDILEISLIEANQLKLSKSPFNVIKVLDELESYFKLNNPKKLKIEFLRTAEKERIIKNDQTRFRQVMTNLLNNAYKYTEKGSIRFGYKVLKDEIKFFVRDTGIGIAEDEYQNIFNYFHKIDKGDNKLYRGAGIGLSISNKLVEMMGGKIWLESTVGKGTTFYFSLPPIIEEIALESEINQQPAEGYEIPNLAGMILLIAEDETNNYILMERILRSTKAGIVWARNGKEAVDFVRKNYREKEIIILMDIKMPVMNGITASDEIKSIDPRIPIIAVTAYAQTKNREEILRHNFFDYIAKPIQPAVLFRKISRCRAS